MSSTSCWTCRIRKKGDCSGPGPDGDCAKCLELNLECLHGYGVRVPKEYRRREITDEISKWNRNKRSRWTTDKLLIRNLLQQLVQDDLLRLNQSTSPYPSSISSDRSDAVPLSTHSMQHASYPGPSTIVLGDSERIMRPSSVAPCAPSPGYNHLRHQSSDPSLRPPPPVSPEDWATAPMAGFAAQYGIFTHTHISTHPQPSDAGNEMHYASSSSYGSPHVQSPVYEGSPSRQASSSLSNFSYAKPGPAGYCPVIASTHPRNSLPVAAGTPSQWPPLDLGSPTYDPSRARTVRDWNFGPWTS